MCCCWRNLKLKDVSVAALRKLYGRSESHEEPLVLSSQQLAKKEIGQWVASSFIVPLTPWSVIGETDQLGVEEMCGLGYLGNIRLEQQEVVHLQNKDPVSSHTTE